MEESKTEATFSCFHYNPEVMGSDSMKRRKQGKLKLRKLAFKAKNGYYPIHKKPATFDYYGNNISNKRYDMKKAIL